MIMTAQVRMCRLPRARELVGEPVRGAPAGSFCLSPKEPERCSGPKLPRFGSAPGGGDRPRGGCVGGGDRPCSCCGGGCCCNGGGDRPRSCCGGGGDLRRGCCGGGGSCEGGGDRPRGCCDGGGDRPRGCCEGGGDRPRGCCGGGERPRNCSSLPARPRSYTEMLLSPNSLPLSMSPSSEAGDAPCLLLSSVTRPPGAEGAAYFVEGPAPVSAARPTAAGCCLVSGKSRIGKHVGPRLQK